MNCRRDVLSAIATPMAVSVAGCVGGLSFDCGSNSAALVETRPVTERAVAQHEGEPIVVGDLPAGERRIARIAVEEGMYRDCPAADPTIREAVTSFANRAATRQGEDGRGPVHLERRDRYYAVGVTIEDQVYASLPPDDPTSEG